MINLVGVWGLVFGVLVGWGLLISWAWRSLAGPILAGTLTTFQTMWLGYAGLTASLELISLVLPIREVAAALCIAPAIAGYIVQRRVVGRWLGRLRREPRSTITLAIVLVCTATIVAFSASGPVQFYDTGLYHLQAVKWIEAHRAVVGLGNLHMRFGYNNSVHLFAAFTDVFWQGMAVHLATSFLELAVISQCFVEIFSARTPRTRVRQIFCLIALPFFLGLLWTFDISSLSTDLPLAALSFVIVLELISLPRKGLLPIAWLIAIAAVALTTKLGGAPAFVVVAVLALWNLRGVSGRVRVVVLALPALVLAGWVIRGIVTSGWLLYPVFGHLPVSWAVTPARAADDLGNIQSWGRMFGKTPEELSGHGAWFWFSPWLEKFQVTREFVLMIVAAALAAWRAVHGGSSIVRRAGERAALAACGLTLVQWFVGAPQLRYGAYAFWLLAAALIAPQLAPAMRAASTRSLVLIGSLAFINWGGGFAFRASTTSPLVWGRLPAPKHIATTGTHTPGDEVEVPDSGDQCFDAPLPCTPYPGTQTMRDPNDRGAGYAPSP